MRLISSIQYTAVALAVLVASGCNTIDTRNDGGAYKGPPTYSGTRVNARGIGQSIYAFNVQGLLFFGVDFLPSLIADTLLLPITIPEQSRFSSKVAEATQIEHDVPSVITPPPGESTLKSAQRLWDKCVSLTAEMRNLLPACYAVDARVVLPDGNGGTREMKGGQYKEELRKILPQLRNGTRAVTYVEPKFEVEGDKVRVKALRADSEFRERTPISFLLGPGPDGEWRIFEQVGEGLPESLAQAQ